MNLSPIEIVKLLLFLATFGVLLVCAGAYLIKSFGPPKPSPTPSPQPVPIPQEQLPSSVRNAAPPAPRYPADVPTAESVPQTSARALQVFQDFGATLVALGVPQEEVTKTLDPYAPLLLKPKASK